MIAVNPRCSATGSALCWPAGTSTIVGYATVGYTSANASSRSVTMTPIRTPGRRSLPACATSGAVRWHTGHHVVITNSNHESSLDSTVAANVHSRNTTTSLPSNSSSTRRASSGSSDDEDDASISEAAGKSSDRTLRLGTT